MKLLRFIRALWCRLLHRRHWRGCLSSQLFFLGKTRQGVTFYYQCRRCGHMEEQCG